MLKEIKPNSSQSIKTLPELDDRLTQKEVAALFGKSVQTIINWKKQEKIPYYLIGINPIFSKKELAIVAAKNQHLL